MAKDPQPDKTAGHGLLGLSGPSEGRPALMGIEIAAAAFSVLWLIASGLFVTTLDAADSLRVLLSALVVILPIAMACLAAVSARAALTMREDAARLHTAVDALRRAYVAQSQANAHQAEPEIARKLDDIARAQRKTETTLAMFTATREIEPANAALASAPEPGQPSATPSNYDDQRSLPLGPSRDAGGDPVAAQDFIRALNFPETAEDTDGFAALRRALRDRSSAQLIQAAQDVLTLLSQDGIYMDDFKPDRARPDIWRRFASGERGPSVAGLGGIQDRASLALTSARMRKDTIFRDAVHHFLRLFDRALATFEKSATDAEIAALADTRTARAFMLLGRVTGTFH